MPSPEHEKYLATFTDAIRNLASNPVHMAEIRYYCGAILLLCRLDLGPAKTILESCYSNSTRGTVPFDLLAMFRLLILAVLIGEQGINALARRIKSSAVLAAMAGFSPDATKEIGFRVPAVATIYDELHRLHDGPLRRVRGAVVMPSLLEHLRSKTELKPAVRHGKENPEGETPEIPPKKSVKAKKKTSTRTSYRNRSRGLGQVTETLRLSLLNEDQNALPDTLPSRLIAILHAVAVLPSAEAGLLGDIEALILSCDGSALETNADGHGNKVKSCPHIRWEPCDCPRTWSDPDAARGWDHYHERYYFGYNFYECNSVGTPYALPLYIGLYPANTSDQVAAMKSMSTLIRYYGSAPGGFHVNTFIGDCGHDGEPLQKYFQRDMGIRTVIPISADVPAVHPIRKEIRLHPDNAVPLCEAGLKMASWGTTREGQTCFICPVKAGKTTTCPLAPKEKPDWVCKPDQKYGPTIVLNVEDSPRLFPMIARNSEKFKTLYAKRTASERSNSYKKCPGKIKNCGHRRWSFWLIRLYVLAIVQHARAWVAKQNPEEHLLGILGLDAMLPAA